jgi:uncharacterized protein
MGGRMKRRDRERSAVATVSMAGAYAAFASVFRGPQDQFWQRMTRTGLALGSLALANDESLRRLRPKPRDFATGLGIAAGLYAVFQVGDRAARKIMPNGADDIGNIYELRSLRPKPEIALRLATIIGPAEELYWRGTVQDELTRRFGRERGALASAAVYGGAHIVTGNPTLVGAATVAGAAWSALRALGVPMPALIVSHAVWDIWIFLVQPTEPPKS